MTAAKEYLASQLGKGVPVLKCLKPECDKIFPGVEVLRFIDLNVFKGVPKERLEIMIERVGVKGLVEICPKCVTVVACGPLEQNSEFVCTNSTCKSCPRYFSSGNFLANTLCTRRRISLPEMRKGGSQLFNA